MCCGDIELINFVIEKLKGKHRNLQLKTEGELNEYIGCKTNIRDRKTVVIQTNTIEKLHKEFED